MSKHWVIRITIMTLIISLVLAMLSELVLRNLNLFLSVIVFLLIILLGIFFDMIGIAFAIGDAKPFNSMAARKIEGSKRAVELLKKRSEVANFCNDVVGDIAGIISGTAAATIILTIKNYDIYVKNVSVFTIVLAALTASLTVGGKALGKMIATKYWRHIIFRFSYVVMKFEGVLHRKLF